MARGLAETVRRSYRAAVAHRHVVAISQHHRIQASPGYRAAAHYVLGQLQAAGVPVSLRTYPADGKATFWSQPSFLEWECRSATLELLDDEGQAAETLCDFAAIPTSVIQRSVPVEGEFEVVVLRGGAANAASYESLDVRGKVILTGEATGALVEPALRARGAAGLLFDGMRAGGRSELDLPDARQYTSFWWAGPQTPDGWGFVVTPRQGQALRAHLALGLPVRVRAKIDSRFYAGTLDVVEAVLPGTDGEAGEEVLLVSHLCHPQPGAHDNGSGSAALIEAAATLARLYETGELPRPRRGIRCLWVPEMSGTYAWAAGQEAQIRAGRWIAGLNLDMVGADQNVTGGSWELVGLPEAAPSFADHLLAWLREPFLDGQRHRETGFSAGSDHYILSDPTVGIPTPMLIQWPDLFYHTSDDTADKVSPDSLARSGALAAAYAYWLASAGPAEARWLGHWMAARFRTRAATLAAQAAEAVRMAPDASGASAGLALYGARSEFAVDRMVQALGTLARLDPSIAPDLPALAAEVREAAAREDAWISRQAASRGVRAEDAKPAQAGEAWRQEAAHWAPVRCCTGPVDPGMAVQLCDPETRAAWRALSDEIGHVLMEVGPLLQYWADGERSIAEIVTAVELETGKPFANDWPLRYLKLLQSTGHVRLKDSGR